MSEPKGLAYITDNMEKLRNRIIDLADKEQGAIESKNTTLLSEIVDEQNRIYAELTKTKPFHIEG